MCGMNNSIIEFKVCNFSSLKNSAKKCKRNVMWKKTVSKFILNINENCYKLEQSCNAHRYRLSKYHAFKVYEPKERIVTSMKFKDRVFQRSYCDNYFYNAMTKSFIYDNSACQLGKGTEFARKRLIAHMQRFYRKNGLDGWVLQTDIHDFFGSTSHIIMKNVYLSKLNDEWALRESFKMVDSYSGEYGLGLGSPVTQISQLALLDMHIDHIIKEKYRIKHFIRYNDDMIFLFSQKEDAEKILEIVRGLISGIDLELNKKKTKIYPFKQGIKFLGFKFKPTETGKIIMTILPEKVQHEKKKLKRMVGLARVGILTKEHVDQCYKTWRSYISNDVKDKWKHPGKRAHRNCYHLVQKMDLYYKSLWEVPTNVSVQKT